MVAGALAVRVSHAQQPALPVIGFLESRAPDSLRERLRGMRQGLKDAGYVEGENRGFVATTGRETSRTNRRF